MPGDVGKAIVKLQDIYNDVEAHLSSADAKHARGAIAHYTKLYDEGAFEQSRVNCEWSIYNDRYGARSILGFAGEVLAVGLWNKQEFDAIFRFGSGERSDETAGRDVVVFNNKWRDEYVVQVKLTEDLDARYLRVRDRFIEYDPKNVHRFAFADITHRKVLVVDYKRFSRKAYIQMDGNDTAFLTRDELLNFPHSVLISL